MPDRRISPSLLPDYPLMVRAARYILADIERFSRIVIDMPLYSYQLRPVQEVLKSILGKEGLEFLFVFPRQSGKNEAVAQLSVYLMNLLQRRGGNMVFGATGDGLGRGVRRLEQRLENRVNTGKWRKSSQPTSLSLGKARMIFISTHPTAMARGETADWLLIIDEMQDQVANHLEAVFEPMRAANNATAIYIGTVKTRFDALWQKKRQLELDEAKDGQRRVFIVSAEEVVAENPHYGQFLEGKIDRFGRHHPIVASEYFNEPIGGSGGLFDQRRRRLMRGDHRRGKPDSTSPITVATLDVGGVDEGSTEPLAQLANPARDYTVAHIFTIDPVGDSSSLPLYRAVDVFADQGSRHFHGSASKPGLAQQLQEWLQAWQISHLVADSSGVGAGLVDWLKARLGSSRVTGFSFTRRSKAKLGVDFLSLIETGRFKYWSGEDEPLSDGWWFFTQATACTFDIPENGTMEKEMRWGVPENARVDTPLGSKRIHDDRLISAALVAVIDDLLRSGKMRLGRASSAIIPPDDPLQGNRF